MRKALVLVALVLSGAACSGPGGADNHDAAPSTMVDGGAERKNGDADERRLSTSTTARGGQAASGGTTSPSRPGEKPAGNAGDVASVTLPRETESDDPPLPLEVALKHDCVRPGESQTISITSKPEAGVGYDSYYSDGKSGMQEGFYGGNNAGHIPKSGTWTDTWVVGVNAPPGTVTVKVLGVGMEHSYGEVHMKFTVAKLDGMCA